jgi:hypothetical protein
MNQTRIETALSRFLELTETDRRTRSTRGPRKAAEDAMAQSLGRQGREFRRGFTALQSRWQDEATRAAIWPGDWIPYFDVAANITRDAMRQGIFANILQALIIGGGHLVNDIGVPLTIAFGINNPRAVSYAVVHAAEQVTRINDATREGINRIIVRAIEDGRSYSAVQRELMDAMEFSRRRARNIAVYEIGDAYEAGKRMAVDEMRLQGLEMVKAWSSVGDDRVRPEHQANQAAGWIGINDLFPGDSAERAPTDPGCRCATLYRRKGSL